MVFIVGSMQASKTNTVNTGSLYPLLQKSFFKGVTFSKALQGLELYLKMMEHPGLYANTQFDVMKCILNEKLTKPEVPTLEDGHGS